MGMIPLGRQTGMDWHLKFVVKDQPILDVMFKDIGNEAILKIVEPRTDIHMSVYPKKDSVAHHVAHEKYPTGHGRRHTQKRKVNLCRMVRAFLLMIAPTDDPSPAIRSLSDIANKDVVEWFERVWPRVFHPPTDRPLKVPIGILGSLLNAIMCASDSDAVIDFTEIVENPNQLEKAKESDVIETLREDELRMPDRRIGFFEDRTKMVMLVEPGMVAEFDLESLAKANEIILEELGFNGFFRTAGRERPRS